jgi:hypothetical protein
MPLILAEALLDPDSAGDRTAADTDTEYSSSSEDEELPKPTQATGSLRGWQSRCIFPAKLLGGIIAQGHLETVLASQCCRPNGA